MLSDEPYSGSPYRGYDADDFEFQPDLEVQTSEVDIISLEPNLDEVNHSCRVLRLG